MDFVLHFPSEKSDASTQALDFGVDYLLAR